MAKLISQNSLAALSDHICEHSEELLCDLGIDHYYQGDTVFMPCPIHCSDDPRSASISLSRGIWKCWTRSCHDEHKGMLSFVRGVLSINQGAPASFPETIGYIKNLYDVDVGDIECEDREFVMPLREWKRFTMDVPRAGGSFYYINRGYKQKTLKTFGVEDCIKNGHHMFGRSIIPVQCEDGVVVGYMARGTKKYSYPKFVNSKGLRKSLFLYNLHRAKKRVVNNTMIIVEGAGDVWRMHEAGAGNTVAIMGKDISYYQTELLKENFIQRLVVLTDNDQPGRESKRSLQRKLHNDFELIFPKMRSKDIGNLKEQRVRETILTQIEGLYK
jgi:5S rRNA maturation endonuclease (ribonuclease M5)